MGVHARTTLPPSVDTPAVARAFARDAVERAHAPVRIDDVALVVSELVTNAVVHGGGEITLSVDVADDCVDVEVSDREPSLPRRMNVPVDAEAGRGLMLVSKVARDWGVREATPGKVVWAHLQN